MPIQKNIKLLQTAIDMESVPVELKLVPDMTLLWSSGDRSINTDDYKYVIKDSYIDKHLNSDSTETATGYTERYGGFGMAGNGGGIRSVNINGMQLKGVGTNYALKGFGGIAHSYGGLDIQSAIKEIIMAEVCNSVLPYGGVKIHALYLTGDNTALYDNVKTWGCTFVRELAVRPSHFIRSPNFYADKKYGISKDHVRLRRQMHIINANMNAENYVDLVCYTLHNNAEQAAAALMSRMCHGSMTHSNITSNGAWIDLPLVSFTNSGVNITQNTDFYTEHRRIIRVIREMIYSYCKYNSIAIDIDKMMEYYGVKLAQYKRIYAGWAFGFLPKEISTVYKLSPWNDIYLLTEQMIIGKNSQRVSVKTKLNLKDPLNICITNMARMVFDGNATYDKLALDLLNNLNYCVTVMFPKQSSIDILKARLLVAMRRAWLSPFFMLHYNDGRVTDVVENRSTHAVKELIDDCIHVSHWVFDNNFEDIVLFSNGDFAVEYNSGTLYRFDYVADSKSTITPEQLIQHANDNPDAYSIAGWDFSFWIKIVTDCLLGVSDETHK